MKLPQWRWRKMVSRKWILFCMVWCTLIFFVGALNAQSAITPLEQQLTFLVKALSFNKNLPAEKKDYLIGILYHESVPESESLKSRIVRMTDSMQFRLANGNNVRWIPVPVEQYKEWSTLIISKGISALYLTPMNHSSLELISSYCRDNRIVSISGVAKYVESHASLGVEMKNSKPEIIINLSISMLEGVQFSSRLLHIARVYR